MAQNSIPSLFRAFCFKFEELRDKLMSGGSSFSDGISIEDGKALAQFLNVTARELECHVCSKKTVILLQQYDPGGQDDDGGWYDICVISGRKVRQKGSAGIAYVCRECLAGRERLRERVAKTLEPVLKRFDELSL